MKASPLVLGAGFAAVSLAKPTSAALLVVLVPAALFFVGPRPGRAAQAACALIAAAAALLVLLAVAWQSPPAFAGQLASGLEVAQALGGHDQLIRVDKISRQAGMLLPALLIGLLLALAILFDARRPWLPSLCLGTAVVISLARGLTWVLLADNPWVNATWLTELWVALPPVVLACWARRGAASPSRRQFTLGITLALLPAVHAFGSNLNYWSTSARAAAFWILACLVVFEGRALIVRAAPVVTVLLMMVPAFPAWPAAPYRTAPAAEQMVWTVTSTGGSVLLSSSEAGFVRAWHSGALRAGISDDDFVLDLSGEGPGAVSPLGAQPTGQNWLIGGYPGSDRAARLALSRDRCASRSAWVLTMRGGRRAIDPAVLSTVGRSLSRDYVKVLATPRPGFATPTRAKTPVVELWRPLGRPGSCSE